MHAFLRTSAFCLLSLTLAGTVARADELLVMPYACAVVGGQPMLTPSRDDEGHRIIGPREQRSFSACSPARPDMCRQWTVHRFDLDCGGVRVPWMSVVAAANARRRGGAWVENGRLHLQMPARWTMEPDDPCADWSEAESRWRGGRLGRYCADRRSLGPPPAVEMPAGFAPMLGIDGVFVASPGSRPSAPFAEAPRPGGPFADAPRIPPPAAEAPRPGGPPAMSPPPPAQPRITRVEPHAPPSADARDVPAREAPVKEPPAKKQPAPRADAQPAVPPPAQAAPSPGTPIAPRIINRIDPAPPGDARLPPTPAPAPPEAAAPPAPTAEAKAPARPPNLPQAPTPAKDAPIAVNLISAVPSSAAVAMFGIAGFAMLVMAAFAYMRQRESRQAGGRAAHDIASASLGGALAHAEPVGARAVVRARPQQAVPHGPPPVPQPAPPSAPPAWGDAIPQTRDEALLVLGMGVRPDATETAIKKIVDGLRLSWHPDHARDAADRQLRELRLKQINAAWEIIAGRRTEA